MTLDELKFQLTIHDDSAVAMRVQDAIRILEEEGELKAGTLSREDLSAILQMLHELPNDATAMLAFFLPGKTSNPREAALQYIECLIQDLDSSQT